MKWRILYYGIPKYNELTQAQIILLCCGLHNFILENDDDDVDFNMATALGGLRMLEEDEDEAEMREADEVEDDVNMNAVRDEIAYACFMAQRRR